MNRMNPVNLEKSCKSCLTALRQRGARDFLVVNVKSLPPDDLVILMSLTRNQHEVAGFSLRYRAVDRLRAISDFAIRLAGPLNSLFRVAQYLLRVLRARIVRRQDHDVAQAARRFTHRRS